jgi:cell fate (sporulation/competence/biofilm development) regulator YlbF (YheA/YmcA/DUF963 family)
MIDTTWNDLEVASKEVVMQSTRQFAEALADTTQFHEFEQSFIDYRQDGEAQSALREFQQKQTSLKALRRINAVTEDDRQELQRLQDRFNHQPSVVRYARAQEDLVALSQEIGDILSNAIGWDYGTSCISNKTGGCCG